MGRTLPLGFVIVLSVFLIGSVVTIADSIDLTVLTINNYTRAFTPVIPRGGRLRVPTDIQKAIQKTPGFDRAIQTSGFFFNVNTVFGPFPFVCLGVAPNDRDYLLARAGDSLEPGGRWPTPGLPEAVVSEGIVRNRRLKIGDDIASPKDANNGTLITTPVPVKLVGILKGPTWIAFTSKEFPEAALPLVPHSLLVTTKNRADQLPFSDRLYRELPKVIVDVFSYNNLVKDLRHSLESMYLIMHLVDGTVTFVVALMAGMLSNIYFSQRITEFATLAAIGLRRSALVWHAVSETAILTGIGWVLGIGVNWAAMSLMRGRVFEPRGMLINPTDLHSVLNTLPIPVMITVFAIATISYRLANLDPVSIIERR